jgi:hypothetical protein
MGGREKGPDWKSRQLERKIEHEQRRTRKNNIVITGCRGEGKSKEQIKT